MKQEGAEKHIAKTLANLKTLFGKLNTMDQETADKEKVAALAKETPLMEYTTHTDKGVAVYTACCLAAILKLCAPDPPYTDSELNTALRLFARQIPGLENTEGTYYPMHFYLVESLATVKSAVLLHELEQRDELLGLFLDALFGAIRKSHHRHVRLCILEIAQTLLDEAVQVAPDTIALLLGRLAEKDSMSAALAGDIVRTCHERLELPFGAYFSEAIHASQKNEEQDEGCLESIHQKIERVGEISLEALYSTIPLLEGELSFRSAAARRCAVCSLGKIFEAQGDSLVETQPKTWRAWTERSRDTSSSVRRAWTERACALFKTPVRALESLFGLIAERTNDTDEKTRLLALSRLNALPFAVLTKIPAHSLAEIGTRCADKREDVRRACLGLLARLAKEAFIEIPERETRKTHLRGVLDVLFQALYVRDPHARCYAETFVEKNVLYNSLAEEKQAAWLLECYESLSDKPLAGFRLLLKRKMHFVKTIHGLMQLSTAGDTALGPRTEQLCSFLDSLLPAHTDPLSKTLVALLKTTKIEKQLRLLLSPETPGDAVQKAAKEVLAVFREKNSACNRDRVDPFLTRASFVFINTKLVHTLLAGGASARLLANEICSVFPALPSEESVERFLEQKTKKYEKGTFSLLGSFSQKHLRVMKQSNILDFLLSGVREKDKTELKQALLLAGRLLGDREKTKYALDKIATGKNTAQILMATRYILKTIENKALFDTAKTREMIAHQAENKACCKNTPDGCPSVQAVKTAKHVFAHTGEILNSFLKQENNRHGSTVALYAAFAIIEREDTLDIDTLSRAYTAITEKKAVAETYIQKLAEKVRRKARRIPYLVLLGIFLLHDTHKEILRTSAGCVATNVQELVAVFLGTLAKNTLLTPAEKEKKTEFFLATHMTEKTIAKIYHGTLLTKKHALPDTDQTRQMHALCDAVLATLKKKADKRHWPVLTATKTAFNVAGLFQTAKKENRVQK
ncbi:MAG: cohesin-associated protein Pds5 [Amphiamblys sp. WSBS2006]|nr:MAG: cohesin-associated protein Pds5 [Amphiamblys sp. WSBS2006]